MCTVTAGDPHIDPGRSTGIPSSGQYRPETPANSTENRSPIRQMRGSLRNLPTVLIPPDTNEYENYWAKA
jgi:hypothetical protein